MASSALGPEFDALLRERGVRPSEEPKGRRGFLDLVAAAMAVYALVANTPVGELVVRTASWLSDRPADTRPLISYFETDRGTGATVAPKLDGLAESRDAATLAAAKDAQMTPELARALLFMMSGGVHTAGGGWEVVLPKAARESFAAVGAKFPSPELSAAERQAALLDGVARLRGRLAGEEAAVAATAASIAHVQYAVDRARASGLESPNSYAQFRAFLPPEQREAADPLVRGTFALSTAFSMAWPVKEGTPISSPFGQRVHPVLGTKRFHSGTDFAVPTGTSITAIARGKVVIAGHDAVNGRFVKLDHGNGLTSAYCHASALEVSRGDQVAHGARVALSGATGRATGPHLHFQLELDGHPVDAELFHSVESPRTNEGGIGDAKLPAKP